MNQDKIRTENEVEESPKGDLNTTDIQNNNLCKSIDNVTGRNVIEDSLKPVELDVWSKGGITALKVICTLNLMNCVLNEG